MSSKRFTQAKELIGKAQRISYEARSSIIILELLGGSSDSNSYPEQILFYRFMFSWWEWRKLRNYAVDLMLDELIKRQRPQGSHNNLVLGSFKGGGRG